MKNVLKSSVSILCALVLMLAWREERRGLLKLTRR